MDIIYFLIGCSIVIAMAFLGCFLWAIWSGQYDDTYTPSIRMLFEAQPSKVKEEQPKTEVNQEVP